MIIQTLVLVTAIQFGGPQSGANIDDLTLSPWRDVPTANLVKYTAAYANPSDTAQGDLPNAPINLAPMTPPPNVGAGSFALDVPDPDLNGNGNISPALPAPSPVYIQQATPIAAQQATTRPTTGGTSTGRYTGGANVGVEYSGPTRVENNKIYISRAIVQFDKISKLSAPVGGIVMKLETNKCDVQGNVQKRSDGEPIMTDLERGVLLFTGQQVAQLDDRYPDAQHAVAETKLAVARKEAAQTITIDYAKAQWRTAQSDFNRSLDVAQRTPAAVTASELELKELKVIETRLQLEKATIDRENQQESVKIQEQEVKVAEAQLDLRKVKTPFNAIVVNVLTQVGNYLKEGDPIAEVAKLDKLIVQANIDGNQVTQQQVDGKRVTVKATNPGGRIEEFEGFVRYAAPMFIDNQRNFQVDIEVDNRMLDNTWQLRQGDYVDVVIHLN